MASAMTGGSDVRRNPQLATGDPSTRSRCSLPVLGVVNGVREMRYTACASRPGMQVLEAMMRAWTGKCCVARRGAIRSSGHRLSRAHR